MYQRPLEHLETIISLDPHLAIVHVEVQGNLKDLLKQLQAVNIKAGVALLQPTMPESVTELIQLADHVLIFSGDLGKYGGQFDESLLSKVKQVRSINPKIEIGWDGGANESNIKQIAKAGVDIVNSGGYIQNAPKPQTAYDRLTKIANGETR